MTDIARAVALLRAGELVAIPTETVYGLGADASQPAAVARIFAAKGRPADHPLIVHLPDASHLDRWARAIPPLARRLAEAFWPGPLTLILQRQPTVLDAVTGGQDTVGLRVPNHPMALELLRAFAGGIAAPSANRFGRISPTTAAHVREELGDAVSLILDGGPCDVGIESTILDLSGATPRILRPGVISADAMALVAGRAIAVAPADGIDVPRASGGLEAHYAPRTPLQLVAASLLGQVVDESLRRGERIAVLATMKPTLVDQHVFWQQASDDSAIYAHSLYANLRQLDALRSARILVQEPPVDLAWWAVRDRLRRAATGSGGK